MELILRVGGCFAGCDFSERVQRGWERTETDKRSFGSWQLLQEYCSPTETRAKVVRLWTPQNTEYSSYLFPLLYYCRYLYQILRPLSFVDKRIEHILTEYLWQIRTKSTRVVDIGITEHGYIRTINAWAPNKNMKYPDWRMYIGCLYWSVINKEDICKVQR